MRAIRRFPFLLSALPVLFAMALAAAQIPKAKRDSLTLLILGDSLAEGYGVEKEEAFPARLDSLLRREGYRVMVVNGGSSGSTSASGLQRFRWYEKMRPDAVLLALGSNDGLRGVKADETRKNVERVIAYARQKGHTVYLAGLKVPPNYGKEYAREFEKSFSDLAARYHLPYLPFLLEGVAGEPRLNLTDGIHPNAEGHLFIAQNLRRFLVSTPEFKSLRKQGGPAGSNRASPAAPPAKARS